MATILLKHQKVFEYEQPFDISEDERYALFIDRDEDVVENKHFTIPWAVYLDMGKPTEITVTVEPGDKLNG